MSAIPDSTFANPKELIADLQRQLAEVQRLLDQRTAERDEALAERDEALAQQAASAEVLQVINSSPGDLQPVFDAMVEKALHLCEAAFGSLLRFDGEFFHRAAIRNFPPPLAERNQPIPPFPGSALERLTRGEPFAMIEDIAVDQVTRSGDQGRLAMAVAGARTAIWVALRKDDKLLGAFVAYRQEVRPFSEKQIALLQNFAAQAVIAMENARLINETREALEQQTAIGEVLRVISGSAFDLEPVLQSVVSTAIRLCRADEAVIYRNIDGEYRWAAGKSLAPEYEKIEREIHIRPGSGTLVGRAALWAQTVQIIDCQTDPDYEAKDDARVGGIHTLLGVPLLRDGVPIGVIGLARRRVEPYNDREIELVRTFADQAVIAIENTRLLNEIRQRQAELRVTFDNMADGVAMFDAQHRLTAWNRNFQQLIDLPDAILEKRPIYADYLHILVERGEFGTEDIEAELNRRLDAIDRELRLERTRPDGRVLEVRRNAVPDGGFVLIYSDITERKRSEAEIRAARDAAEAAYRDLKATQANLIHAQKMAALGQLTAGIAHEIKNPLNFVNNFAGLSVELLDELKESAAPGIATLDDNTRANINETAEMLTGNLDKIAEHGKRADNIVISMLAHSRGTSGERRAVDLNALVDEALNLAYHGARAQNQRFNITLERNFQPGLTPIELAPQEMTRVFLNLFSNGFYAANRRAQECGNGAFRPNLAVGTREEGDAIAITVRDNGTGIPPEIKDKLFQPFFTTKPTGEGTGLGLSISYDIITQQHGGTITVESEPGAYTEFTIRLPRQQTLAPAGRAA